MSNHDPRFGDLIKTSSFDEAIAEADIVILGVPTDEGIIRNGGRPGAAQAPDEIRKYLHKLTPFTGSNSIDKLPIADIGNVSGSTLEEIHSTVKDLTAKLIASNKIVIALGGGHDITYPLAAGFSQSADLKLLNVDAHLDVRPRKNGLHHSGSSFRLLIEDGHLAGSNFTEFAIQSFVIAKEHFDWALGQGASIMFYDEVSKNIVESFWGLLGGGINYLSFDIDSIRSADAPGCSAPTPIGLTAFEACRIARLSAEHGVRMLDIVEVSPPYDIDGKTARLAARMIAYFLAGLSSHR